MLLLYRLLFLPALVLMAPALWWRMHRRGGYRNGFGQRFGRLRDLPAKLPGVKRIWLHTVSVGETGSVESLVKQLAANPHYEVILTTTTSTGQAIARQNYTGLVRAIAYFPLDFWPIRVAGWKAIQPDLIVLTDSEMWPELLHQSKKRKVPVLLVNGRMSDRASRRYQKTAVFMRPLLAPLARVLTVTKEDERRWRGILPAKTPITFTGNLKLDRPTPQVTPLEAACLRAELGFEVPAGQPLPFILLGSSTWPGEEAILLEVTQYLRQSGHDVRLLLTPRHAERGDRVFEEIKQSGLACHQRSQLKQAPANTLVYLADTTGELPRFTALADGVFIGKSFPPEGDGQSPIEAAALGKPILFGPKMRNFRSIAQNLERVGAAQRVQDAHQLEEVLRSWIDDPTGRAKAGAAGQAWVEASRGATDKALAVIREMCPAQQRVHPSPRQIRDG